MRVVNVCRMRWASDSALRSSRLVVPLAVALLLAACGGTTRGTSSGGSCADVIVFEGAWYIGGRGVNEHLPALVGAVRHATTAPCPDGNPPIRTVDVRAINGVRVEDAVVALDPPRVVVSKRLWSEPRASLPKPLQPYIHADGNP